MVRLLEVRGERGYGPKDPLFPGRKGRAPEKGVVVRAIRRITREPRANEHSLRRSGAQLLARRGVPLHLIQFLGRWGGDTVKRYVAEALRGQLTSAVARGSSGGGPDAHPLSLSAFRNELVALVKRTLEDERATSSNREALSTDAVVEAYEERMADETPGAPLPPPGRVVTGTRGLKEIGFRHDVVACDPCLPRETWVTRCGWRFGLSAHIIYEQGVPDCPKCAVSRRTGRGALFWQDKRRKTEEA